MSFFSKVITVPKNTSEEKYEEFELAIQNGVIHRIEIIIPAGHAGLTGVRLLRSLHQIAPTSGSEWFIGDDVHLSYAEFVEISDVPFSLSVEAYNEDDTYAHSFVIGVAVLPKWILLPQIAFSEIMSGVSGILGGMSRWLGASKEG